MKLIFPNGEHASLNLAQGVTLVGSDVECQLRLSGVGIAARHCEIHMHAAEVQIVPADASAVTLVNGQPLSKANALKQGDLLQFSKIACRVMGQDAAPAHAAPRDSVDDTGHTRVRMALPKLMLRGVSGPTFGKTFPVSGSMTMGRQADCDICITSDAISRHHARLQLTPAGVLVEDLGSANGTYINDKPVQGSVPMQAGDELRLDTVRFQLQDAHAASTSTASVAAIKPAVAKSNTVIWIVAGAVVVAVGIFLILRQAGVL